MPFTIRGVHPVAANEPCHLLEAELDAGDFDWGSVTQAIPGEPESNWQVPWDERPLDDEKRRWAFFFHYLDFNKPLSTPDGDVPLPPPTPIPQHLANIDYESPY
jgi:hypothetical protein